MRIYLSLTIVLLSFLHSYGQTKPTDKSLLWRVSSKELKEPSYLFGTIHLICQQDYVWTPAMQNSLKSCKEVCFEMDIDDPNITMQIAMGMIDNSGKTLKDYFADTNYAKLERYVKDSLGMGIEVFARMKPVALQTLFATRSPVCQTPVSYENNIMEEAQKTSKPITGLETVQEQLDLFDNLPTDSVIQDIADMLNGKRDTNEDYGKLIAAYKKQDLPALARLIKESGATDKDIDGFLDVRNEKWIPRMVEKMDKQSVFFAVGAGHLYGDNGLINLLRKAGYTVTPVK